MEQEESTHLDSNVTLCRKGCGFFGSSNTYGLCSKCYKDNFKDQLGSISSVISSISGSSTSNLASTSTISSVYTSVPSASKVTATKSKYKVNAALSWSEESSMTDSDSGIPMIKRSKKRKNKCKNCNRKDEVRTENMSQLHKNHDGMFCSYNNDGLPSTCSPPSPPYSGDENCSDDLTNNAKSNRSCLLDTNVLRGTFNIDMVESTIRDKINVSIAAPASKKLIKVPSKAIQNIGNNNEHTVVKKTKSTTANVNNESRNSTVLCNICQQLVKPVDITLHLFFGSVKCEDCNIVVKDCLNFSKINAVSIEGNGYCPHKNLWFDDPINNLKTWLGLNSSLKCKRVLQRYLEPLRPLWNETPWRSVVDSCNIYMKFLSNTNENEEEVTLNNESDGLEKVDNIQLRKKSKIKSLKEDIKLPRDGYHQVGTEALESINLPKDGFYLVVTEAIEECPNCYTKIDVKSFSVSMETCLIDMVCSECFLKIYFVLNPPDGSKSRVKIIYK